MSNRANRLLVALLGVVLIVGAACIAATRNGSLAINDPNVVWGDVREAVTVNQALGAVIVIAGALILASAGIALVARELRLRRQPHAGPLERKTGPKGRTRIETNVVEKAVAWRMRQIPGVHEAKVSLLSTGRESTVSMKVHVFANADLSQVAGVVRRACEETAANLSIELTHAIVEVDVARQLVPRVR